MGFTFRKTLKAGPMRVTLSKSGVNVSTGAKGLRVGSGPRGAYVSGSAAGLTYRKTLSNGTADQPAEKTPAPQPVTEPANYGTAAQLKKQTKTLSVGSLIQLVGLACPFTGWLLLGNIGAIAGVAAFIAFFIAGGKAARVWTCSACGAAQAHQAAQECANCRASFIS